MLQVLYNGYQESSHHRAPGEDGGPAGGEQMDLQGTVAILEAEKEELKAEVLKVRPCLYWRRRSSR